MTIVETLVAATLLLIGALGTFALIDTANDTTSSTRAREGATNLGREVLEDARSVAYTKIGQANWFQTQLQGLAGGTGAVTNPSTYAARTTVNRRGFVYTVTVTPCSVDDSRDGYGTHPAGSGWCADSGSVGTNDGQPEDMKRVLASVAWTIRGRQQRVDLTATFGSAGVAIGPAISSLGIIAPTGLSGSTPTITVNPANGIVTFRGASTGAYDMRFTVNGADQTTGVTNNGNGTWNFNWNITAVKDGTYSVGAVAIDALGTRGQPLNIQLTLNRNVPAPLANPTGGYNYVYVNNTKTLAVEGAWDANTEGNVTGYEMLRGTTSVCGGSSNQVPACIDTNPPTSGTTNYTIKTWYRDGAGNLQSLSNTFPLTAPTASAFPTRYYLTRDASNPGGGYTGTSCAAGSGTGSKFDMLSNAPAFTSYSSGNGWVSGCLPPFPAGVAMTSGSMTLNSKWINSAGSDCGTLPVYVYLNGTTLIAGTGINGGGPLPKINKNTTTSAPQSISKSFNTSARTFSAGDQLSFHTPADTFSSNCSGVSLYFSSAANSVDVTLPLTGPSVTSLSQPSAPTGLSATANPDGTTTLTWNAASGSPTPDFYRVYRDGRDYTDRVDTVGDDGTSTTYSWTDSATGGTVHSYYVTTASTYLAESTMAGPVSG
ncbi:MAG TPA: hypothetical protein VJT75_15945 [Thermoleophilaceae bacterium]|nr:hypothetical protein [Thermoleophilaceae bacterium]